MNKLKNLNTGEMVRRLYHDDELSQTFNQPPAKKEVVVNKPPEKPKLK
jgi:hypothetical protein